NTCHPLVNRVDLLTSRPTNCSLNQLAVTRDVGWITYSHYRPYPTHHNVPVPSVYRPHLCYRLLWYSAFSQNDRISHRFFLPRVHHYPTSPPIHHLHHPIG